MQKLAVFATPLLCYDNGQKRSVEMMTEQKNDKAYKIVLTALMAALCYVAFTFLKIPIPTMGGDYVALHIGNAFCVLAALLLGGGYGGVAGALGMTIADLLDPVYITSAPKTFVLKLCIGLIAGFIAHRVAHITKEHDTKYIFRWVLTASIVSLGFNVVMDPIAGYFYKNYILGIQSDAALIMSTWAAGVTFINAVAGTIVTTVVYMAVRPVLKKAGLFLRLS